MKLLPVYLALALTPAVGVVAAPAGVTKVTPMTVDNVDKYDVVRPQADFIKRVDMVPMRDGVKLYTVTVMKKGTKNAPILLSRTPYDAKSSVNRVASQSITEIMPVMDAEFVEDNYIRVYQDIRGLHNSEGDYVTNRPLAGPLNSTGIDESTDAYDTIDWLVKNLPENNGKVGIVGSSYLGFTALMAEINPHPALKAAVPQSPMVDGWMGDDWFHYGAFRNNSLSYAVSQSTAKAEGHAAIGMADDYSRYLEAGSTADFAKLWGFEQYPFVQKLMQNPAYTEFWSLQAVDQLMASRKLTVPTMLVVGQWDQEDSYGAPAMYKALEPQDKDNTMLSLVIGPWRHSGVNHYGYKLGALNFRGDTAQEFRVNYMKPFFDHHLKGAPDPKTPPVLTYATGTNQWQVSQHWPAGTDKKLYLTANNGLSFKPPAKGTAAKDDYLSDPAKPVPFVPRPINMDDARQWKPWLVQDQRFASSRPDVLVYQTDVLDKPLQIMGQPLVDLYAATTGTDGDFVVKLIDVYPNTSTGGLVQGALEESLAGFEMPVGIEIFRGRYAKSFAKPEPLKSGAVTNFKFGLPHVNHVFLPGHKIMVQIQSSLFPLYDRNPQTYVDNIFMPKSGLPESDGECVSQYVRTFGYSFASGQSVSTATIHRPASDAGLCAFYANSGEQKWMATRKNARSILFLRAFLPE